MKGLLVVALALILPVVQAQNAHPNAAALPPDMVHLEATASNQRVDLSWNATSEPASQFIVFVYQDGRENQNRTVNETRATFFLTNGRTYVFQVAIIKADGTQGPLSHPVAATPQLENDLAYLAAGLIAVWLGLLGYAAFLARKESSIEKKLERILQARFEGKNP